MFGSVSVLPDYIARLYAAYTQKPPKPNVVVVGYGWAGVAFTDSLDKSKYNLRVIAARPKRLNQPEMIHGLAATYKNPPSSLTITEDECIAIVEDKKLVNGKKAGYKYDYLVVATGGQPNHFNIPGVEDNCIMFQNEKQLDEVKKLAEEKDKITIVGAGPTGIELAFKLKSLTKKGIDVIEATPHPLPGFHPTLRKRVIELMDQKGIYLHTDQKIQLINTDNKHHDLKILHTQKRQFLSDGKPIWTCGIRPSDFMLSIAPNPKPDEQLRIRPHIWAIGDSIRGHGPPTAQNAEQQGKYLAEHFNSDFKSSEPYKFREFARVLDLSDDGLLIEKNGYVVHLPSFTRKIFYALID